MLLAQEQSKLGFTVTGLYWGVRLWFHQPRLSSDSQQLNFYWLKFETLYLLLLRSRVSNLALLVIDYTVARSRLLRTLLTRSNLAVTSTTHSLLRFLRLE